MALEHRRLRGLLLALRAALLIAGLLWGLYLVAMNLFLSTSCFDTVVNGTPNKILIRYRRGYSVLPGRIVADGLAIRSRDASVDFLLKLDHVTFDVSLLELAKKTFHVTRARGEGISFRARRKVPAPTATRDYVEALPPIDGLGPLPIRPPDPPGPDVWSDAAWDLFTIRLEDVVANDVREVWIDHLRFQGTLRVAGRFMLKPLRRVEVGPLTVDDARGRVDVASRPVFDPAHGRASLTIDPFDPRLADPVDIARAARLELDLQAACPDLANLPPPIGPPVSGAVDLTALHLSADHGRLLEPSRVVARGPDLHVSGDGARSVRLSLEVRGRVTERRLVLEAHAADVIVTQRGADAVTVPELTLTATTTELGPRRLFEDAHAVLDVPRARVDLDALARAGATGHASGRARVEAWAQSDLAQPRVAGSISLWADRIGVRRPQSPQVEADRVAFDAWVGASSLEAPSVRDVHARARIERVSLALGDGTQVRLEGPTVVAATIGAWDLAPQVVHRAAGELSTHGQIAVDGATVATVGRVRLTARTARAPVSQLRATTAVDLEVDDATMPDARRLNRIVSPGAVLAFESGRARLAARLALRPSADPARPSATGQVTVNLADAVVRFARKRLTGRAAVRVRVADDSAKSGGIDVGGSRVDVADVHVTDASDAEGRTDRWRGSARLRWGRLRFGDAPRFEAGLEAEATDASPILALVAGDLPKPFRDLVRAPDLRASGRLGLARNWLAIRGLEVDGGSTHVRGGYVVAGDCHRGAIVLEKGPLSIGVRLGDDGGVHLFNLDAWLAAQRRALQSPCARD